MSEEEIKAINEAKERLKLALPQIFAGFAEAEETGTATIAIAARNPDGGGKMILTMNDPKDFLQDIATVLGITMELTDKQKSDYAASKFLAKFAR